MDSDFLKQKASELWELIIRLETEKYDLEERQRRQDYDVSSRGGGLHSIGGFRIQHTWFADFIIIFREFHPQQENIYHWALFILISDRLLFSNSDFISEYFCNRMSIMPFIFWTIILKYPRFAPPGNKAIGIIFFYDLIEQILT